MLSADSPVGTRKRWSRARHGYLQPGTRHRAARRKQGPKPSWLNLAPRLLWNQAGPESSRVRAGRPGLFQSSDFRFQIVEDRLALAVRLDEIAVVERREGFPRGGALFQRTHQIGRQRRIRRRVDGRAA